MRIRSHPCGLSDLYAMLQVCLKLNVLISQIHQPVETVSWNVRKLEVCLQNDMVPEKKTLLVTALGAKAGPSPSP